MVICSYRLDYKGKTKISFLNEDNIIVISSDGKYYIGEFNSNKGGECSTSFEINFLQIDNNK